MQLMVQGKQIKVGDALREHVEEKIEDIKDKYFNRLTDASVTFSREGQAFFKAHISLHVGKNIDVMADAIESEPYAAFDIAASKVSKQLRRYKRKLRDHHDRLEESPEAEILKARDYVIAVNQIDHQDEDNDNKAQDSGDEPLIIAEMVTNIQSMSVSEAVMRMDLSGRGAVVFRNPKTEGVNIVYKREDGNVGWIDVDNVNAIKKSA